MMQKVQGLASYGYGAFIDDDDEKERFERDTRFLVGIFNSLQDYATLIVNDHSSGKILEAPGYNRYKYLLSSDREALFYTHTEESGAEISEDQTLRLGKLDLRDGPVCTRIIRPHDQSIEDSTGEISYGNLDIALPAFFEDIAVHILPVYRQGLQGAKEEKKSTGRC